MVLQAGRAGVSQMARTKQGVDTHVQHHGLPAQQPGGESYERSVRCVAGSDPRASKPVHGDDPHGNKCQQVEKKAALSGDQHASIRCDMDKDAKV